MSKTINGFTYELSNLKDKKLMTLVNGKRVHFGNKNYSHFFDKTGLLPKSSNHLDKTRRQSYLARSGGIKDKTGALTANNPKSANYHAIKILW